MLYRSRKPSITGELKYLPFLRAYRIRKHINIFNRMPEIDVHAMILVRLDCYGVAIMKLRLGMDPRPMMVKKVPRSTLKEGLYC